MGPFEVIEKLNAWLGLSGQFGFVRWRNWRGLKASIERSGVRIPPRTKIEPMKDLVKKLRKYEIQIRKAINSQMQGDFHSIFKGSGLEFDDVRGYQYGDDIRTIDWNVSAKGHGTFVKTFKEEKEQTVLFILDVSGSQEIGSPGSQKLDIGKEICGVLALKFGRSCCKTGCCGFG